MIPVDNKWLHSINMLDLPTKSVPLHSVYQAPSHERSFSLLLWFSLMLTYLGTLSISGRINKVLR